MASDNFVTLTGNLTKEPELRFTNNGAAALTFGLAVNRRWQNRQTQEWEEQVSFFDIVAWRDLAENVAETVNKGDRVTVTGRLEQRTWDDKTTGDKRYKIEVIADDISISLRWATAQVTRKTSGNGNGGAQARPAAAPAPAANAPEDDYQEPF